VLFRSGVDVVAQGVHVADGLDGFIDPIGREFEGLGLLVFLEGANLEHDRASEFMPAGGHIGKVGPDRDGIGFDLFLFHRHDLPLSGLFV
jgi:hypothetical protein